MSLLPVKLPAVDTRLIKHDNRVYKLRLTYKSAASCTSGDAQLPVSFSDASIQEEIEKIIRVVFHRVIHDTGPCKVQTDHFLVDCMYRPWPAAKLLVFEQNHQQVQAHSEMLVLTLTAKAKESVATAVGQQECAYVGASSRGRMVSSDVCKHRGRPVLQTAADSAGASATVARTNDIQQQDKTSVSSTQQIPTVTASGTRVCRQSTRSGTSVVHCSSKPQAQAKHCVATRSGATEKAPPKCTQSDSGSPSKQRASKDTRHQHYHQGDGNNDQGALRKTRSQQCQTKGGVLLQQEKEERVAHELCRHPLHSRRVHQRGNNALVQHEELREEMKLQHFAKPSSAKSALSSPVTDKGHESSLKRRVYEALDVIMTPVKKIFRSGSEVLRK